MFYSRRPKDNYHITITANVTYSGLTLVSRSRERERERDGHREQRDTERHWDAHLMISGRKNTPEDFASDKIKQTFQEAAPLAFLTNWPALSDTEIVAKY